MKNIRFFLSENFMFLEVKFFIYLNRRVFVMNDMLRTTWRCAIWGTVAKLQFLKKVGR